MLSKFTAEICLTVVYLSSNYTELVLLIKPDTSGSVPPPSGVFYTHGVS